MLLMSPRWLLLSPARTLSVLGGAYDVRSRMACAGDDSTRLHGLGFALQRRRKCGLLLALVMAQMISASGARPTSKVTLLLYSIDRSSLPCRSLQVMSLWSRWYPPGRPVIVVLPAPPLLPSAAVFTATEENNWWCMLRKGCHSAVFP